ERYKMATKETKGVLMGEYGKLPVEPNAEVLKKVIGDAERITCRPADRIKPELDTFRKEIDKYIEQEEDVLTYALFPQLAIPFFQRRLAKQKGIDTTIFNKNNMVHPI
ncbi:MAG: oxaloacetate decarboxylase subunit alpha, partial [Clostridia bacterium]|nr:oxaloacetate decarboxylase subunit alpha [Clostridia bacterium]